MSNWFDDIGSGLVNYTTNLNYNSSNKVIKADLYAVSIFINEGTKDSLFYNSNNQLISKKRFNYFGLALEYTKEFIYNVSGILTNINYISNNNISTQMDTLIYNPSGQLINIKIDDGRDYQYLYNSNNNFCTDILLSFNGTFIDTVAKYNYNSNNQLESYNFKEYDFASCDYYEKHGKMLPDDWKEKLGKHDAIFFGAVGMPDRVPDHISLWGSLLQFRREFDQYINLRPVKLFPGINPPLANKKPGDIDMLIVRENTEGEYSTVGGRMYKNTDREIAIQETIMSAHGIDRVQKFAFELAKQRKRKKLTNATKSNGISITMPFWDERFNEMKKNYPEIETDQFHIDILVARFVLNPEWFDVVVASNLFGDILSDLGPACTGTIGIAPSGNINPENKFPSLFEPVHGSAPDIAGKGIANPVGQIWSGAMMLDYLGEKEASNSIVEAIEKSLSDKSNRTKDLGGDADTIKSSNSILANL